MVEKEEFSAKGEKGHYWWKSGQRISFDELAEAITEVFGDEEPEVDCLVEEASEALLWLGLGWNLTKGYLVVPKHPYWESELAWVRYLTKIVDVANAILEQDEAIAMGRKPCLDELRQEAVYPASEVYYLALLVGHGDDTAYDYHNSYVTTLLEAIEHILKTKNE